MESREFNARHALGDGDGGEAAATIKNSVSNTRQLRILRDVDSGEAVAVMESIVSNTRHTLGEGDGGEVAATIESIVSNTCHTPSNGYFSEFTVMECIKGIVGYRGYITIYRQLACAIMESTFSNTRHALGDGDSGEAAAIIESRVSNTRQL